MKLRSFAVVLGVLLVVLCVPQGAAQDEAEGSGAAETPEESKPPADAAKRKPAPSRSAGGYVFHLVVSADGSRVAASTADRVRVWDVDDKAPLVDRRDRASHMVFQDIGLSKDGRWLVTLELGADRETMAVEERAKVWSVTSSSVPAATYGAERSRVDGESFRWPILLATFDAPSPGLLIWRHLVGPAVVTPETEERGSPWTTEPPVPWKRPDAPRRMLKTDAPWPKYTKTVSFSPDGTSVAVSEISGVQVYSWPEKELLFTATGDATSYDAEFGGGGSVILATAWEYGDDGQQVVIAFDQKGRRLWQRRGVELLALSRAGRIVTLGDLDPRGPPCDAVLRRRTGGVELIDAQTGKVRARCPGGGRGSVTAAVFSPDGQFLWLAHRKAGDVRQYELPAHDRK